MSYILGLTDADHLRYVRKADLVHGSISEDEFDHMMRLVDGLWQHGGDPSSPHAEMTSGNCTDGFVNVLKLLKYSNISMLLAEMMAEIYRTAEFRHQYRDPDWVVGSDHAGATFSQNVAFQLGAAKHEFTEKGPDGKTQVWKRETIRRNEMVLQVEELVSTTATLQRVRDGINEGNAQPVWFVPVSLTLVHRSPAYEFDGGPIFFFRHYDINQWSPEECPLCAAGSARLRPKQHWAELTAA
jgi:orotate phosphoribosyltransferase